MFQLFNQICKSNTYKGSVISPFSLNRALLSVKEGCGEESKSRIELQHFLDAKEKDSWNSFCDYVKNIQSSKIKENLKFYQVVLWNLEKLGASKENYQKVMSDTEWLLVSDQKKTKHTIDKLNRNISDATKGNIPNLVSLSEDEVGKLVVIIANAIYFNAKWLFPFPEELTKKRVFYSLKGEKRIETMDSGEEENMWGYYSETKEDGVLCELVYKKVNNSIRFGMWMPPKSNEVKEWRRFLESLSFERMDQFVQTLTTTDLSVQMPKFEVNEKFDNLQENFEQCGVKEIFTSAFDFSKATSTRGIHVSKVIHQVVFKVHEQGTEAAAATAVVMNQECAFMKTKQPIQIRFNRPFIYYLRDVNVSLNPIGLLFMGTFCE